MPTALLQINKSSVVEPSTQASESRIGEGGNEVPEHDQYVDQQAPVDPPSGPTSTSTSIVIVDRVRVCHFNPSSPLPY